MVVPKIVLLVVWQIISVIPSPLISQSVFSSDVEEEDD